MNFIFWSVTYFARDLLRSYFYEPQKYEIYFLSVCVKIDMNYRNGLRCFKTYVQTSVWQMFGTTEPVSQQCLICLANCGSCYLYLCFFSETDKVGSKW